MEQGDEKSERRGWSRRPCVLRVIAGWKVELCKRGAVDPPDTGEVPGKSEEGYIILFNTATFIL